MTTETAAKRDIQKLQRAIVDGLEDVKAQDIQVFDTEHLSSLFERVIIASGTSNRQTKALAASVRDAVREAGFAKPRIEGEANGEWIIVDCSQAVVHIMQPTFRAYYHLEELWGEKPVRLKFGASKPAVKVVEAKAPAGKATGRKTVASKTAAGKSVAAKSATGKGAAGKSAKPPARKPAPAPARAPAAKLPVKRVVVNSAPAKKSATGARKPAARKPAARKP
ncbi:MAG: ribosome silencing factor [Rhodoferax sp.]|nr:ribosome silencing factor [Rhodoferax sp.]MBP9927785.1 ribosome silencing factor [Rhodoferax sp.]HQZ06821.1 ribosome silencing factor [Burkholderiaceae bacterium]